MRFFVRCAVTVAGLAVLSACAPAQPPTAPSTPTATASVPVCAPLDGSTPFPCTQADFESLERQRALYEEAELVLVRFYAELERQEVDWRLREMTPELEATTTGRFREFTQRLIDLDRQDEARRVGDPSPVVWVRPLLQASRDGSVAALRACVDGTKARYLTKDSKDPKPGVAFEYSFYFAREDDGLKISNSTFEEVDAC